MARYLYSELSRLVQARRNCAHDNKVSQQLNKLTPEFVPSEWFDRHTDTIEKLVSDHMPHGSGFDSGAKLDLDRSHADKLVFTTSFHHMNDGGFYDGWTEHTVTVTPSLSNEFNLRISGRNRNDIKEMMYQEFDYLLRTDVTYDLYKDHFPELPIGHYWKFECPFCHCTWDNRSGDDTSTARNAHTCGDRDPKQYHAVNETQVWTWDGQEFKSWQDARLFAGEEMYRRFMQR